MKTVNILECIPEDESCPCSEGKVLKEFMKIVNFERNNRIEINYKEINNNKELLFHIYESKGGCLYISCHGDYDKDGTYLETPDGRLYSHEMLCPPPELVPVLGDYLRRAFKGGDGCGHKSHLWRNLDDDDKPVLVVLSSCYTAKKGDLIEAFLDSGCRYVIAPREEVEFGDSALFTTTLFGLIFWKEMQVSYAFNKAKKICGDAAKWLIARKSK